VPRRGVAKMTGRGLSERPAGTASVDGDRSPTAAIAWPTAGCGCAASTILRGNVRVPVLDDPGRLEPPRLTVTVLGGRWESTCKAEGPGGKHLRCGPCRRQNPARCRAACTRSVASALGDKDAYTRSRSSQNVTLQTQPAQCRPLSIIWSAWGFDTCCTRNEEPYYVLARRRPAALSDRTHPYPTGPRRRLRRPPMGSGGVSVAVRSRPVRPS